LFALNSSLQLPFTKSLNFLSNLKVEDTVIEAEDVGEAT
jgi:hypothetical protein